MSKRLHQLLSLFLPAVLAAGLHAQQYEIVDLGPAPSTESAGQAVNDGGRVVGSVGAVGFGGQAMYTDGAGIVDLGPVLGNPWASLAWDVAPDGTIVGWRQMTQGGAKEAFASDGATVNVLLPLSTGWDAQANGVNAIGTIVGASWDPVTYAQRAVRWDPGSVMPVDLSALVGSGTSTATDINTAGSFCGQVYPDPYVYAGGQLTLLPLLPGHLDGGASALNDMGIVVGRSGLDSVLWENGTARDLSLPSWGWDEARDINDLDMVVGFANTGLEYKAFLWTRGGGSVLLEDLVVDMGGFSSLQFAYGINARGEITGVGKVQGGTTHAFLARPRLSLLDPSPGSAGTLNRFTVIGATPGAVVHLGYAMQQGSTPLPGCPGVVADLANGRPFLSQPADGEGVVVANYFVPSAAAGRTVYLQAVELATCSVSNLVVHTF